MLVTTAGGGLGGICGGVQLRDVQSSSLVSCSTSLTLVMVRPSEPIRLDSGNVRNRETEPTEPGAVGDIWAVHLNSKQLPRPGSLCTLIVPPI